MASRSTPDRRATRRECSRKTSGTSIETAVSREVRDAPQEEYTSHQHHPPRRSPTPTCCSCMAAQRSGAYTSHDCAHEPRGAPGGRRHGPPGAPAGPGTWLRDAVGGRDIHARRVERRHRRPPPPADDGSLDASRPDSVHSPLSARRTGACRPARARRRRAAGGDRGLGRGAQVPGAGVRGDAQVGASEAAAEAVCPGRMLRGHGDQSLAGLAASAAPRRVFERNGRRAAAQSRRRRRAAAAPREDQRSNSRADRASCSATAARHTSCGAFVGTPNSSARSTTAASSVG